MLQLQSMSSRFATLAGICVFAFLCTQSTASKTCVCEPETNSESRCCNFTDPKLAGNPAAQLALYSPAQCICRQCRPKYTCVVGGSFLCRCQHSPVRVIEKPPLSQTCVAERLGGCTWTPYERLTQNVPASAKLVVGSKAKVDVYYRGKRIGGGDGTHPRFAGKGGVFNLKTLVFDVAACRWPLVVVARKLRRGQARDSFGLAIFYDGRWTNAGCHSWPSQMIRGLGSPRNSTAYLKQMSMCSFADVQQWPSVGTRTNHPPARGLGRVAYQQIYDKRYAGSSFAVAATLPFCQGSSLE